MFEQEINLSCWLSSQISNLHCSKICYWLIDWLIDWSIDQWIDWLDEWMVDWLNVWSIRQWIYIVFFFKLTHQSINQLILFLQEHQGSHWVDAWGTSTWLKQIWNWGKTGLNDFGDWPTGSHTFTLCSASFHQLVITCNSTCISHNGGSAASNQQS